MTKSRRLQLARRVIRKLRDIPKPSRRERRDLQWWEDRAVWLSLEIQFSGREERRP